MTTLNVECFSSTPTARRRFSESFDRTPFLFDHTLHLERRFTVPALRELASRMAKADKPRGFFLLADEARDPQWGSEAFLNELRRAFDQIESSQMRLKLSFIHRESGYEDIVDAFTRELSELTAVDLAKDYHNPIETLFVTSPSEVTPFHVDSEANFLLQIYGTKTVYVFDGNDRELVSWQDLEEYWHGFRQVTLRDEFQSRALAFELQPGTGVHIPLHFPHWVQNGPTPSISLSLAFSRVEDPLDVLRVNRYVRRLGIEPTPPGKRKSIDASKRLFMRGARTLKSALRRRDISPEPQKATERRA